MARFTIRVELLSKKDDIFEALLEESSGGIYNDLHNAMEAETFLRIIKDEITEKLYNLPPAEYNYISDLDNVDQVTNRVEEVVKLVISDKIDMSYRILVTESENRRWVNLEESDRWLDFNQYQMMEIKQITKRIDKLLGD
ncbi:hypothetical protein [Xanthocytophaga agilis]|uniref:Uncharacterized protein n=1 Tax=Xanthocytophaga agilis TaxID=3048010 RepID=A0AAE3QZ01_9BACT|nr:hypothetical protein [Xanthocytophaga agilis]MDJ1500639.1 hypothetical protein [Xanthocytophaga agilis]